MEPEVRFGKVEKTYETNGMRDFFIKDAKSDGIDSRRAADIYDLISKFIG